jgi:hypothetical protein
LFKQPLLLLDRHPVDESRHISAHLVDIAKEMSAAIHKAVLASEDFGLIENVCGCGVTSGMWPNESGAFVTIVVWDSGRAKTQEEADAITRRLLLRFYEALGIDPETETRCRVEREYHRSLGHAFEVDRRGVPVEPTRAWKAAERNAAEYHAQDK